jgi:hypothetical protein
MSPGPPTPYLRASDADREAAVERLNRAAVEGRLDHDELDERVAAAYSARWTSDLQAITADITPAPPAPPPYPYPYAYPVPYQQPTRTNGLAVSSLICGLVWFWWLGSACAIVFGHVALNQIKRSEGRQTGSGMAIAGLVLGYLALVVLVITLIVAGI